MGHDRIYVQYTIFQVEVGQVHYLQVVVKESKFLSSLPPDVYKRTTQKKFFVSKIEASSLPLLCSDSLKETF